MNVRTIKLIFIPVILLVNLAAGGLPFCILRRRQAGLSGRLRRLLSLANCFSSGVFLATCFVGLLPNVQDKFRQVLAQKEVHVNFPFPELALCLGFFLVWSVDLAVHSCVHCCSPHQHEETRSSIDSDQLELQRSHLLEEGEDEREELVQQEDHSHHSHLGGAAAADSSLLKSVMLTVALGSHSTLEGLGFSLLDTTDQVTNMAVAMVLHEALCALSLGISLSSRVKRPCAALVLLVVFSLLIPLGIVLGLLVDMEHSATLTGQLVAASLQGLVAGTFLYVVFCEILPAELAVKTDSVLKVGATALGFLCIATIRGVQSAKAN